MFFMILGTYRNQTFIDFSPAQRIQLMIFLCHTVTHGTDLRRSPHMGGGLCLCYLCAKLIFISCVYLQIDTVLC